MNSCLECPKNGKAERIGPIHLSLEEVAVCAGHEIFVTVDDNNSLSVGDPRGILDQQFMPRPICLLNIVVKLIRVNKLPVTAGW